MALLLVKKGIYMSERNYNLLDLFIVAGVCIFMTLMILIAYSEINKDLAEQVDYYRTMYHEKDIAVKILQEKCGVE